MVSHEDISVQAPRASVHRDRRWLAACIALVAVLAGGALIAGLSDGGWWWRIGGSVMQGRTEMSEADARKEIHARFQQGVVMLHARQYEHAMTAFHRVLQLDPQMPEAHVDMGFALIGLQRFDAARDFFNSAIALRREQVNAYYGLALALDALRDRPGAVGAMRTYVHLSKPDAPHARKAELVLRDWEARQKATMQKATMAGSKRPTEVVPTATDQDMPVGELPIEQP